MTQTLKPLFSRVRCDWDFQMITDAREVVEYFERSHPELKRVPNSEWHHYWDAEFYVRYDREGKEVVVTWYAGGYDHPDEVYFNNCDYVDQKTADAPHLC